MKIVSLEAENLKRINAVNITPDGNMIVIGGKNAQGKSSVLDSIMMAIGGKSYIPSKPIKDDGNFGYVKLDLGDIIVKRVFTSDTDSKLTITNKEGSNFSSPQTMLNRLVGDISFNPLEFASNKHDQLKTLKKLLGIDFTELDTEYDNIYDSRRFINKTVTALDNKLASLDEPSKDTPTEEVSVADLIVKLSEQTKENQDNETARKSVESDIAKFKSAEAELESFKKQLAELENKIKDRTKLQETWKKEIDKSVKLVKKLKDHDTSIVEGVISDADRVNKLVANRLTYLSVKQEFMDKANEADEMTAKLNAIKDKKKEIISSAEMPIEGLSFNDDTVLFNGLPFSQASSAERLRVSVALAIALNPELSVMLIKDGSLLDEDNLKMISDMAEAKNHQIWMERVGSDENVTIIMEDGNSKGVK